MDISKAIQEGIEKRLKEEAIEISNHLIVKFENEMNQKIAGIALDVSRMVEYQTMNDRIVITVRKPQ